MHIYFDILCAVSKIYVVVTTETWCIYFALLYIAIKEALKLSKVELPVIFIVSQVDPSFVSWPDTKVFARC